MIKNIIKKPKAIIIGAGIAGLTIANCFLKAGIDFIILEKQNKKREYHGSEFYLCPNGIRVLDQLGIWNKIKDLGTITTHIDYYDKNGKEWASINWEENINRYGYPVFSIIRQKLLIELWKNIEDEKIEIGKKVINIENNKENIKVKCHDNSFYIGDFVVGADGAWSETRNILYRSLKEKLPKCDKEPFKSEYKAIFGVSKISPNADINKLSGRLQWHIQPNLSYFLHIQPGPKYEVTWFLGEKVKDTNINDYKNTDINKMKRKYGNLITTHNCNFKEILDRSIIAVEVNLEEKLFETWYKNRIVLIGDSAHKLLPFGAQGANQAIEDAVVLTNCLYEFYKNYKNEELNYNIVFEKYQNIRKPRIKEMIKLSQSRSNFINIPNKFYEVTSKILHNLPQFILTKMDDDRFKIRPILNFIDPPKIIKSVNFIEPDDFNYNNVKK